MNAIILCGGLSTRLGEITKSIPKILLEIKGKTVLEHQTNKLKQIGIKEVVLAAGHLSDILYKEVGENFNGVKFIYAIEKTRLGTGGAIKHAWDHVTKKDEPVIILNGDILTTIDISDMIKYLKPESDGMLLGAKVDDAATYGTLVYDENYKLIQFKEKEGLHEVGYINGGYYILTPHIKRLFPKSEAFSIEHDVFSKPNNLYIYESDRPWIDIGVPERLDWARKNWKD